MGAPIGNKNAYKGGSKHFHGPGSGHRNSALHRKYAKARMRYAFKRHSAGKSYRAKHIG